MADLQQFEGIVTCSLNLKEVLDILRNEKNNPDSKLDKRRVSEAITCFETGCMFMIGSMFPGDYDPTRVFNQASQE